MQSMRMNLRGFSLVELSIVLVIVGLLVGGMLTGQSLMKAAQLNRILKTNDQYRTAMFTFKNKYGTYPGDIPNATAFWGYQADCPVSMRANNPGDPGTCNGNGDGQVVYDTTGWAEWHLVWPHLSRAGLIEGDYRYSAVGSWPIGVSSPKIDTRADATALMGYWGPSTAIHDINTGHFIRIGTLGTHSGLSGGIVAPQDAYSMDLKVDDGKPGTGSFLAIYNGSDPEVVATRCVSNFSSPNAVYNLQYTTVTCSLNFKLSN